MSGLTRLNAQPALLPAECPPSKRTQILAWLGAASDAPRVFSPASLLEQIRTQGWNLARPALMETLAEWTDAGHIDRVRRGLYLNACAHPAPALVEATPWVRKEAVVSLGTVLGAAGVLHHPAHWITAVVPLNTSHAVGTFNMGGRIFQIAGLHPKLLPDPKGVAMYSQDAYDETARVPTATPEKALLDWIYLGRTSPLWTPPDPQQLQPGGLDRARLERLARHMDLVKPWEAFVAQAGWGPPPAASVRHLPCHRLP